MNSFKFIKLFLFFIISKKMQNKILQLLGLSVLISDKATEEIKYFWA